MSAGLDKLSGLKQIYASLTLAVWGFMGSGYGFLTEMLKFDSNDFVVATNLWQYVGVFATGIAIIMFLVDLDKCVFMMQGNFSYMKLFEPFAKFVVAMIIISNGGLIVSWIANLNNWFIDKVSLLQVGGENVDVFTNASYGDMNPLVVGYAMGMDIWSALIGCVAMFVMFIIALVPTGVMCYNAITRKIEFILRVGFAPVAFADVYKGMDSTGVRYIKKLVSLVFYGGGMVLVLKIGAGMCKAVMEECESWIPQLMNGVIPTTSTTSWAGQIFGTIGSAVLMGSGLTLIGTTLCTIIGLLGAVIILFAELGACSMIKQACNDVLGV